MSNYYTCENCSINLTWGAVVIVGSVVKCKKCADK